jgi:glycosyltransferase involved in cell wall biosynthesis
MPKISLIATVYNDVEGTRLFLRKMEQQTRRPDEIVICDAGSKDGTWDLLTSYEKTGPIPLKAIAERRAAGILQSPLPATMYWQ